MVASNSINESSAGLVKFDGTSVFSGVTVTQHDLLIGAASNGITSVAPSATSGVPVISQGASADPAFGTAVVAGGGTGDTSFTAYSVITGGTTSTGALQNVSGVGTSGQVLTSNGASALPTWQAGGTASGSVKAWANFSVDGSGNTTINDSFNVTSIGNGGPFTVTLTSAFSNSNYVVVTNTSGVGPPPVNITNSSVFSIGNVNGNAKVYFMCIGS